MQIILPDLDTLKELHDIVLDVSGGVRGVHNEKLLISAVERPQTYTQYVNDYDIDTICAILIDSIARYHGFRDGNKRTALMTVIFTYRINGVHFRATEQMNVDFDEMVMWVVTKKPKIEDIVMRLQKLRELHDGESETWLAILKSFVVMKLKKDKRTPN